MAPEVQNPMKLQSAIPALALALLLPSAARLVAQQDPGADIVLLGSVVTMDETLPAAEAVVIRRGLIAEVGSREMALSRAGPNTRIIEAPAGGAIMPGIIESHAHLLGVGRARRTLDLTRARSAGDACDLAASAAASADPGTWISGRGWNHERWPDRAWPDRHLLDARIPGHPVALTRVDGHALWANSLALSLAGITANSPNPPGGEILKDASGQPTGILIDNAMILVTRLLPSTSEPAEVRKDLLAAQEECLSLGVTTFVDAGTDVPSLGVLNDLYQRGSMKLRVYAMLSVNAPKDLEALAARPPIRSFHGGRVSVRAWKLYADGALGSRGAWLLEPYADRPGHSGLPVLDPAFVERAAVQALRQGFQLCVHAIGDRGVRETLDAIERALLANPEYIGSDHRFRIEHAQIVAPEDVPRFRTLGVIPSMQGCHCTSDGPWVPDRLGARRAEERGYIWRTFLDAGLFIPNGTDAPVEALSPWWNFYSSITRFMDMPQGPVSFTPGQRMSRTEALLSMTAWGAQGIFAERELGLIRPGMKADVIIANRHPLRASAWHVGRTEVLSTIIEGEVVFERTP